MEGEFGAFTYWAGGWSDQLSDGLIANGQDGELVFMPPIAELGKYWQRCAPVYAITSSCKIRKAYLNISWKAFLMMEIWKPCGAME